MIIQNKNLRRKKKLSKKEKIIWRNLRYPGGEKKNLVQTKLCFPFSITKVILD